MLWLPLIRGDFSKFKGKSQLFPHYPLCDNAHKHMEEIFCEFWEFALCPPLTHCDIESATMWWININKTGFSSCPTGCKISPHNSKVSIEQNFASSNKVAVVETIKLTWNDPKMALTWSGKLAPLWTHYGPNHIL